VVLLIIFEVGRSRFCGIVIVEDTRNMFVELLSKEGRFTPPYLCPLEYVVLGEIDAVEQYFKGSFADGAVGQHPYDLVLKMFVAKAHYHSLLFLMSPSQVDQLEEIGIRGWCGLLLRIILWLFASEANVLVLIRVLDAESCRLIDVPPPEGSTFLRSITADTIPVIFRLHNSNPLVTGLANLSSSDDVIQPLIGCSQMEHPPNLMLKDVVAEV
jgi:hypothetical protein